MLFNSIEFLTFFVIVFSVYHFFLNKKTTQQNILLLIASYVFYAWANWKILPLLAATTISFYFLGIAIHMAKTEKRKQLFTILGVVFGIGTLLYFKYFNFFIHSFKDLFESFGIQTNLYSFNIMIPVGISFYTFRLLSYVIDIYREKIEPARNIIEFAAFVAFFPCLLAGPIDRPATLIPQLQNRRIFDFHLTVDGMRQVLWGLFKKVVIADNCVIYVDEIFGGNYQLHSGSTLLLAAVIFSFQMYADFSGYSDMAIGVAKILGFRVTRNFDYPFFAQNIAEYWRKWHISLTSWLTDYIFMPLNIKWRDKGNAGMIAAIIITFILVGLWHGDNWKFAFFGLYHGLLYIPLILTEAMFKKNKIKINRWGFPKPKILLKILLTFALVTIGNIIFRADSAGEAFAYLWGITANGGWFFVEPGWRQITCFIIMMMLVEWIQRQKQHGLDLSETKSHVWKFAIYYVLIAALFVFGRTAEVFIYFQF